jgi:hypothetical protein
MDDHMEKGMKDHLALSSECLALVSDRLLSLQDENVLMSDCLSLLKDENVSMSSRLSSLQDDNNELKKTVHEMKKEVIPCTNKFVWKISNFKETLKKAKESEDEVCLYRDPFYTEKYGYKLRAMLYPNESRDEYAGHMSIFIQIVRGEYDALLPWPFAREITFTLVDQKTTLRNRKNVKVTIDSEDMLDNPECFKRPTTDSNDEYGNPTFVSHKKLMSKSYIRENSIFLLVEVQPGSCTQ